MARRAKQQRAVRKTTVRHGKLRRSNSAINIFKTVVSAICVILISAFSVTAYALLDLASSVQAVNIGSSSAKAVAGAKALEGDINILLVGSDSRAGQSINDGEEGELNDVTMMLRISQDHSQVTVVSFPRDLMVPIPSCPGPNGEENYYSAMAEQQFNSTLQYGLGCVVRTVEELTGAEIPYAGVISFDGVINMSNAIGGVDVCLAQPIVDPNTDLDLPAGDVTLVGVEALQFLRTRYGVGDGGDQSRISNQQVFMSAMLRKIKSAETLLDPGKVYGLAKAAVENMSLSQEMASVSFMQSFAATVQDVDLNNVNFLQYPVAQHPYDPARVVPDYPNATLLMDRLLADLPVSATETGLAAVSAETVNPEQATATEDGSTAGETTLEDATATAEAAPTESTTDPATEGSTTTDTTGQEQLPGLEAAPEPTNVFGQSAADVTCSTGRTRF